MLSSCSGCLFRRGKSFGEFCVARARGAERWCGVVMMQHPAPRKTRIAALHSTPAQPHTHAHYITTTTQIIVSK
jgi:hypothetical protein